MNPPGEFQQVSGNANPVYRLDSVSGIYFLKEVPDKNVSNLIGEDIGIPTTQVVEIDGTPCILMEEAVGRPLSLQLPIVMLPGVWRLAAQSVLSVVEQIGRYLGTLHSVCHIGDYSPDERTPRIVRLLSDVTGREPTLPVDSDLPYTQLHGDPTPHNIFADLREQEANIIDFNLCESFALEDVVVFETGIFLMAGRIPGTQISTAEEIIESFRKGYNSTGPQTELRYVDEFTEIYQTYLLECYPDQHDRGSVVSHVVEYLDKRTLRQ